MRSRRGLLKKHGLVVAMTLCIFLLPVLGTAFAQQNQYLFHITIATLYGPGSPDYGVATVLQDNLRQIGIDSSIVQINDAQYRAMTDPSHYPMVPTYENGGFDIVVRGWTWLPTDWFWFKGCFLTTSYPPMGWNENGWADGIADNYLNAGQGTYNVTARQVNDFAWQKEFYYQQAEIDYAYLQEVNPMKASLLDAVTVPDYSGLGSHEQYWHVAGKTLADNVTVTMGTDNAPTGLSMMYVMNGEDLMMPMYDGLVMAQKQPDGTFAIAPDAAQSWDLDQAKNTITFHLRHDVNFTDGYPMTAQDVKWTMDAILDPETASTSYSDLSGIFTGADIIDNYTIRLDLNGPQPMALSALTKYSAAIMPEHILRDVPHSQLSTYWTNTQRVVGTGPFKFVAWTQGTFLRLEVNLGWFGWGKKIPGWYGVPEPQIKYLYYKTIPEYTTQLAALQTGEVDMVHTWGTYPPEQIAALANNTNFNVKYYTSTGIAALKVNVWHPILGNVLVRQAISHALPRDEIISKLYGGHAVAAAGTVSPIMPFFDSDLKPYTYDLGMAKQLLAEAGYVLPQPFVVPVTTYATWGVVGLVLGAVIGGVSGFVLGKRRNKKEE